MSPNRVPVRLSRILLLLCAAAGMSFLVPRRATAATSAAACTSLARLALPGASVTSAEIIAAGRYQMPAAAQRMGGSPGVNVAGLIKLGPNPAFCRVVVTMRPSTASDIKLEVWLPLAGWNHKFMAAGNFGWGGGLMYSGMLTGLLEGYATASNDTGHEDATDGPGGRFALGHPQKLIDYAYRADHEMAVAAKAIIKSFYGTAAKYSYWVGCSLGGLEGLIEAKRYPADFNGIVAGAPPNPLVNFNALQLWPTWLIQQEPSRFIPESKYVMVHEAVLKACASPVGLKEGLLEQPARCDFDPAQLQCTGPDAPDCLTAPQVYLLRETYAGPVDPVTHQVIFPGPAHGSELQMLTFATQTPMSVALDLFRYAAFQNADWSLKDMDWHTSIARATRKLGSLIEVDSNLRSFFRRGGKLLMYIGWNDYHNPQQLISYYQAVARHLTSRQAEHSMRLFTIPGMNHCQGGEGCDTFDKLGVLDQWVAHGTVPQRVVASRVVDQKVVRTRPLCAYPEVAEYKGSGSTDDAANFVCEAPQAGSS